MMSCACVSLRIEYVLHARFFFFKQKTAYEMRISDWSSDVCSSDLVDRDDVAARALGRQRVANRGAFMEDGDAVGLQPLPYLAHRLRARGLDDLDPAVDDRLSTGLVIGGVDLRKDGQVHAERVVGVLAAAFDPGAARGGGWLGLRGQDAQDTRRQP